VGINGKELTATDDPWQFLDGPWMCRPLSISIRHRILTDHGKRWLSQSPVNQNLRQRAWVEDNRRLVDKLSEGKLAYIWVPNTSGAGFVSFNRYFFAQQDKKGAVIDERFNGWRPVG